jgi:hypothetical protein
MRDAIAEMRKAQGGDKGIFAQNRPVLNPGKLRGRLVGESLVRRALGFGGRGLRGVSCRRSGDAKLGGASVS